MQNFNKFNDSDYISDAPDKLNDNFQTIASDFAGTSFPTTNLVEGMICYRTDEGKVYRYRGNSWQLEYTIVDGGIKVEQATNDATDKAITSYVAKVEVGSTQGKIKVTDGAGNETEFDSYTIATQTEAEVGANNTKGMTPLRVAQEIDSKRPIKTFTSLEQLGLNNNATIENIAEALPQHSMFFLDSRTSNSAMPNLGLTEDELIVVRKTTNSNVVAFHAYGRVGNKSYYGTYTSWAYPKFSGWQQLAAKGALSMPSVNVINIPTNQETHQSYLAPADGWVKIAVTTTINEVFAFGISAGGIEYAITLPARSGYTQALSIPVTKNTNVVSYVHGATRDIFQFYYAQSEV